MTNGDTVQISGPQCGLSNELGQNLDESTESVGVAVPL